MSEDGAGRTPRPARSLRGFAHGSWGVNGWTLKVYTVLYDAGQAGLTLPVLVDECALAFNQSATMQWWADLAYAEGIVLPYHPEAESTVETSTGTVSTIKVGTSKYPADADYRTVVLARARASLYLMSKRGEVISTGNHRSTVNPLTYYAGTPPRMWVRPTRRGPVTVPYDVDKDREKARRHVHGITWKQAAREELARAKPRPAQVRHLLEQALDLYGNQGGEV